jgi:PIN domain nuclease of toxin-antitoxin system
VLLDTHVLIWLHREPARIGKQARRAIENASSVYYSPLSLFEFLQKDDEQGSKTKVLAAASVAAGLVELTLDTNHVMESSRFGSLKNTDPFDRLLISQSSGAGMDFYTADIRLLSLGFPIIKDATV